ncbi:LIP-domain-containing protein [Trematosphaeria pertusa]|uniref:LIP-domain-containing protein n=1 Tax=Trematosphaeria pertusa TaxID=390896 RepID=A0A6A6IM18_9PLEO|nr:LIP-domain-containing protein [Trematosphaeria pertusa]KAF2250862.1 LIP-domain-containing protein [Trematosphaeria pertusa]
MRSLVTLLPALACTVSTVLALPLNTTNTTLPTPAPGAGAGACIISNATSPILPSKDPWYKPPANSFWETTLPGTVLCSRPAPAQDETPGSSAMNILFRTTDSHDNPTWTVTTVLAPSTPRSPPAMISYQHFMDSPSVDDSPSYRIYKEVELYFIVDSLLQKGYYVNMPDYEGPKASFTAGKMSGHATLDSVTAALRFLPDGIQYAMYGYSGGSFATEWAAELAESYAPKLHFAGAGIGGAYPNVTDAFEKLRELQLTDSAWGKHLRSAMLGIGNEHQDAADSAMDILISMGKLSTKDWEAAKKIVRSTSKMDAQAIYDFSGQLLQSATVQNVLEEDARFGLHGLPRMPMVIHRHELDPLSSTAETTSLWFGYCFHGARVLYHLNPDVSKAQGQANFDWHRQEGIDGMFKGMPQYFEQMFNGTFLPDGCRWVYDNWTVL